MALSNLFGWTQEEETKQASACGTACGAGDDTEQKPSACGSACGAGDK
ncbi:MAG: ACGX-repeat peptide [Eubacterium sp.]|nr:ACGX-repeat peptide [Eubacterium sp.]